MSDRNPQKNDKDAGDAPGPAIVLRPDNFTPPHRTPWGGHHIVEHYKAGLGVVHPGIVGESWEISVEPDFPSRTEEGPLLADVIAAQRETFLGAHADRGLTALLVKLLDTAAPLSVQIHPSDEDPNLSSEESGKPEAWYVLNAQPDAGLYIGLREGVTENEMRRALDSESDISQLLTFVPAEPGDFFVIEAGTPHAIGAGLTLIEPQRVLPGRRGVTYRYWDWNRRYDGSGKLDASGDARPLHREQALRVTRWDRARGPTLLQEIRTRTGTPNVEGAAEALVLSETPLHVTRLVGTGALSIPDVDRLQGLTVVGGTIRVGDVTIARGQSAVIPARSPKEPLALNHAHALLCSIPARF